ncbi:MAG: hypothetical protein JXB24_08305 [Bacteroidales bacterium]|nr:hypothetical protein [Bacteroidales bacterium]
MKKTVLAIAYMTYSLLLASCTDNDPELLLNQNSMKKPSERDWNLLAETRIFFGHRSVGNNILDGITELKNESDPKGFSIIETKNGSEIDHPLFAHALIGENRFPKSKIDEFVRILDGGMADSADLAFMKLCFADINRQTDIKELFDYYKSSMDSVKTEYPHLKIFHITVPLIIKQEGIKGLIKRILLMDDNLYRHRYNELMRACYNTSELFDLAKIESTFPDNTGYLYGIRKIPGLIPQYASDGGHLNQTGKLLTGNELLHFIVKVVDE